MRAKGRRLIALVLTVMMLATNVLTVFAADNNNTEKSQDAPMYTLAVEISGQETVKVTGDEIVKSEDDSETYQVKAGSKVTVEVSSEPDYKLSEIRLNDDKLSSENLKWSFQMPEKDSRLVVKLKKGFTTAQSENSIGSSEEKNPEETQKQDLNTSDNAEEYVTNSRGITVKKSLLCDDPDCLEDHVGRTLSAKEAITNKVSLNSRSVSLARMVQNAYVGMGLSGTSASVTFLGVPGTAGDFAVTINDGQLQGVTGTGYCVNHGAANPGEGGAVICDWEATCTAINGSIATWDVLMTPPGACEWGSVLGYQRVSMTVSVRFKQQGKVQIKKSSAMSELTESNSCYSLAGAVYGVYSDSACSKKVGELTTKSDGGSNVLTLDTGDYYVKELKAPKGFALDTAVHPVNVTADSTATLSVKDYPQNDPVSVLLGKIDKETNQNKPQGSATLANAEFTVKYYDVQMDTDPAKSGKTPVRSWVMKTDDRGFARLEDKYKVSGDDFYNDTNGNVTLPLGTVTIQETKAPTGYLINDTVYVRQITSAGDLEKVETYNEPTVPETPQKLKISLEKQDSETGATPQGEAVIDGAVYEIFDGSNKVVDTLTIKNGKAVSKELPLGNYTVKEKKAPTGYLLDPKIYTVKGEKPKNSTTRVFTYQVTSKENVIRGDVEIIKVKENQDEDNDTLEGIEGVEFTFTSKVTGKVVTKIVTDKVGMATTAVKGKRGALPYGTYIVTETKYPAGLKPIEPFEVTIREDSVTLKGIYKEDKLIVSPVSVVKKDKSSGMTIPVKDTEFRILDADKNPITMTTHYPHKEVHETFKTDENGQFTLPEKLKYGTYYLEEVKAPEGYLKGELLEFKVTKGATWENPLIIEYADDNAVGKIRLEKIDSENKEPLAGATFDVIAAEDILTPDGTVRASKDTVVDTLTTDEHGMAESKELYLGKYLVRETGQPDGYLLLQKDLDVELTYKDQDTAVVVENLEVANKPTNLIVRKQDQDSKERLAGVKFSICPKEEHGQEGHECKTYVTDKNGEIEIKRLAPGTYLIQEVKGLDGYSWDTAARKITIDKNGQIDEKDIGILTVNNAKTEITKTSVLEIESKSQVVYPKEIEAVDTVSLKNLQKGETYTLIRELRDVETGELLFENNDVDYNHPLRSQKEFEATDSKMDVEMEVSFDATEFAGRKIVVFEELYQNGQLISEHTDLKDEKQQLTIKNPKLHTTATDKTSGTHEAIAKKDIKINDEVQYEDIIPGTYILKGIVMDKKTKKPLLIKGKEVTAEKEIEIKEDGTVQMEFTFDASELNNKSIVIYEYLYKKGQDDKDDELITSHEDIKDEGQTVIFKVGSLKAKLPGNTDSGILISVNSGVKTGDQAPTMFFMFLMAGACVVAYQMRKKLAGEPKSEEEKN